MIRYSSHIHYLQQLKEEGEAIEITAVCDIYRPRLQKAEQASGGIGYMHHQELLQTIRAVAGGQALFGPPIAVRILGFFQHEFIDLRSILSAEAFPELTPREMEILELIADGATNSQIAEILVISHKTVRNHISNIFSKLQVADRAQAILKARDAGLGSQSGEPDQ